MEKIKVKKENLLQALKKNRETHISEYNEVHDEYQKDTIKALQKVLREAKKAQKNQKIDVQVHTSAPVSQEKDYDIAIGMLEFSVDETFEINQQEYKQFVLNEWYWSDSFAYSKSMYLKG